MPNEHVIHMRHSSTQITESIDNKTIPSATLLASMPIEPKITAYIIDLKSLQVKVPIEIMMAFSAKTIEYSIGVRENIVWNKNALEAM